MKRHPVDGAILMVVDGYAFNVEEGDFGYGFVLLRFHTGKHPFDIRIVGQYH